MVEEVDSEILITRRVDADFSESRGANHSVEWLSVRELIQFYDKSAKPPTEVQRIHLVHQLALVCSNKFDSLSNHSYTGSSSTMHYIHLKLFGKISDRVLTELDIQLADEDLNGDNIDTLSIDNKGLHTVKVS